VFSRLHDSDPASGNLAFRRMLKPATLVNTWRKN